MVVVSRDEIKGMKEEAKRNMCVNFKLHSSALLVIIFCRKVLWSIERRKVITLRKKVVRRWN